MELGAEKKWIVKSSGAILGPFHLEELIQALSEKRITIIDEVRSPDKRWVFIREHPEFQNIVQFLREQQANQKEDTGATYAGSKATQTAKTITHSQTDKNILIEDQLDSTNEIEVTQSAGAHRETSPIPTDKKKFVFPADPKVIRQQENSSSLMRWSLVALVFVAIFAFGYFYSDEFKPKEKTLTHSDYLRLAKSHLSVGNYPKTLEFLKKSRSVQDFDFSTNLIFAPMIMMVDNENIQARRILEAALEANSATDKNSLDAESLIALTFLREGQLEEAKQRYLQILQKNQSDEFAKLNLIEIKVLQADFKSAYNDLNQLMKEKIRDPIYMMYRSLIAYRLFQSDNDKDKLQEAVDDLGRYQEKSNHYLAESFLIQAGIQKKLGQMESMQKTIIKMLQVYPDLTNEHISNYFIHRESLDWKYLGNICEILLQGNDTESFEMKALDSYCNYQQNDLAVALEKIEKASLLAPREPVVLGLKSFLLMKADRTSELKSLFALSNAKDSYLLRLVEAITCEKESNTYCAESIWKQILSENSSDTMALAGLARISILSGDKESAADYVKRGWLKSSSYMPILEIKQQLDLQ